MAGTAKRRTTKSSRTTQQRSTRASGSRTSSVRKTSPTSRSTRSASQGRKSANTRGYVDRDNEQEDEIIRRDVIVILLFALNVFLFLSNFGILGPFGDFFRTVMFGLIGLPAYVLPLFIFGCALFYTANADQTSVYEKIGAATGLFLIFGIICELTCGDLSDMLGYSLTDIFTACSEARHGGGAISGSIAYFLYTFLKMPGTILILLFGSVICVILISRKSFLRLLEGSARNARDSYRERRENAERYRMEHPEEFTIDESSDEEYEEQFERPRRRIRKESTDLYEDSEPSYTTESNNHRAVNVPNNEIQFRGIVGNTLLYEPDVNRQPGPIQQTQPGNPDFSSDKVQASEEFGVKMDDQLSEAELELRLRTRQAVAEQDALAAEFEKRRHERRHPSAGDSSDSTLSVEELQNEIAKETAAAVSQIRDEEKKIPEETAKGRMNAEDLLLEQRQGVSSYEKPRIDVTGNNISENLHEIHLSDFEDPLSIMYPDSDRTIVESRPSQEAGQDEVDYMSDSFSDMIIGQGIGMAINAETTAHAAETIAENHSAKAPGSAVKKSVGIVEDLHTLGDLSVYEETQEENIPEIVETKISDSEEIEPEENETVPEAIETSVQDEEETAHEAVEPDIQDEEESAHEAVEPDIQDEEESVHEAVEPDVQNVEESPSEVIEPVEQTDSEVEQAVTSQKEIHEKTAEAEAIESVDVEIRRENADQSDNTVTNEDSASTEDTSVIAYNKDKKTERNEYVFPPLDLLTKGNPSSQSGSDEELRETAAKLQHTLKTFGVNVKITDISQGPAVTRYEMQPEQGVKVSKILSLSDDIKLALAATDIRIEAPIPGKSAVGIEVPNKITSMVALRDILQTDDFRNHKSRLAFGVGKDISGQPVVADIAKMPHVLIAGATGSGKSVCINTIIMSILYHSSPDDVKLIMIDPKVVELSVYNGIPHLLIPVVTDPQKASAALNWAVAEMTARFAKFADAHVRDLASYNAMIRRKTEAGEEGLYTIPQLVVIVDELADLMMVAKSDVETAICRLAQLARAAGIHLIIATQRPSVDVITGLIKANMPSRIAFAVTSGTDSRTILDRVGAEKLLGKGDMLFFPQNLPKPSRIQGAFVSDEDVSAVVDYICSNNTAANIDTEIQKSIETNGGQPGPAGENAAGGSSEYDELIADAGRFIIEKNSASIGLLQRRFRIGFNRAARIMDQLCDLGVVGEAEGTKSRRILMTPAEFETFVEESL